MIYLVLLSLEIFVLYFLSRQVVRGVYQLLYRATKKKNWTMYLFAILFLPGTFIHEMSHFLAALFLLVPVGNMELTPKEKEDGKGFGLGSVAIAKTDPVRRFIIGVAPLIFGLGIIFTSIYFVSINQFIDTWWGYLIVGIIIFQIANSMFASKKDLEGAIIFFVLIILVLLLMILLGVDVASFLVNFKLSTKASDFLINANVFLLVPIVVDALVLIILKKFK